jgi:homoserine kinase type II
MDKFDFIKITGNWDIDFKEIKDDIDIYGSPERSNYRVVLSDKNNSLYILERISKDQLGRKEEIANNIFKLKKNDKTLKIYPYLLNKNNHFISEEKSEFWLMSPYIKGIELERPGYIDQGWRGKIMADFLIELIKSGKIFHKKNNNIFALDEYIIKIEDVMKNHNSTEYNSFKKVIDYLKKEFFPIYPQLPLVFCHGDFHPINIIWSEDNIKAVIDWEFCGFKPEMYDVANMVGCLGIENPSAFKKEITTGFLNNFREKNLFSAISWDNFINLMISIRFGWLSEWFRKRDQEMIELEIIYINLIFDNIKELKSFWSI